MVISGHKSAPVVHGVEQRLLLQATNALPSVAAPWAVIPPPYLTNGPNLQFIEAAPVGHKFNRLHKP